MRFWLDALALVGRTTEVVRTELSEGAPYTCMRLGDASEWTLRTASPDGKNCLHFVLGEDEDAKPSPLVVGIGSFVICPTVRHAFFNVASDPSSARMSPEEFQEAVCAAALKVCEQRLAQEWLATVESVREQGRLISTYTFEVEDDEE